MLQQLLIILLRFLYTQSACAQTKLGEKYIIKVAEYEHGQTCELPGMSAGLFMYDPQGD
jgi:hypothetical protein